MSSAADARASRVASPSGSKRVWNSSNSSRAIPGYFTSAEGSAIRLGTAPVWKAYPA